MWMYIDRTRGDESSIILLIFFLHIFVQTLFQVRGTKVLSYSYHSNHVHLFLCISLIGIIVFHYSPITNFQFSKLTFLTFTKYNFIPKLQIFLMSFKMRKKRKMIQKIVVELLVFMRLNLRTQITISICTLLSISKTTEIHEIESIF